MPIKCVKIKFAKNKRIISFLMSKGSLDPKIRFLGQKVCSVACIQTDTHESENIGYPGFRVSGLFPSNYHQGSVHKTVMDQYVDWNSNVVLT